MDLSPARLVLVGSNISATTSYSSLKTHCKVNICSMGLPSTKPVEPAE